MAIWKRTPSLDELNAYRRDCLVGHLGIDLIELGDDVLRGTMPVDARTRQPFGLLHGGASVALAETLGSLAAWLCLDDPQRQAAVGLEINANHVRAVRSGIVTGTARPEHLGRSTHVWSIRIEDEASRLVCLSRLTMAIVERDPA
ncbi:hotdog fold thioesterase [Pseudofulvimonas gallinarii]|jgi:1,4-dihydroxy-2-naphthoyl-CoA hydrolase|uniref:1,4-dihydroxy-2-naphthoyl-CoA hydrolase n=1 Tax=Pseudofulvimonas gallinarii TaxID=634155 RepID=A0A4R3L5T0_9GAMM|nr:hotdog fold thioesterase [Pseudofulvimonas gallinarii]TCS93524.1 1,4-dihydroxy-2-naphthoyl-CoA hydrolase [Pseudofulvimonas gallinarii]THD14445.1 esterase [Pseudofulvimonas gallinarii]